MNRQSALFFLVSAFLITNSLGPMANAAKSINGLPLAAPSESHSQMSKVIGWKDGEAPVAPKDFTVTRFASNLDNPRQIYVAPNGDVFVAESDDGSKSANRVTLFRDSNGDGKPDLQKTFKVNLLSPFGMLIVGDSFYIANTDNVRKFAYKEGQLELEGTGTKLMDLSTGHHWTRNLVASPDGKKIYVSVGSGSNIADNGIEKEKNRACIFEMNPDGSGQRIYGSGLRNPVGMAFAPGTSTLWTAVNERDGLGDDLVPDYMTSVKDGGFYGWPYSYYGQNVDKRVQPQNRELVKKAIVPDVALGAHTASLGLTFYDNKSFPEKYRGGAFVGQHGSWNRSKFVGYRVAFVPFKNSKAAAAPEDFLTGFIANAEKFEVHGRPVGVAVTKDGALLVADDAGRTIWRVAPTTNAKR